MISMNSYRNPLIDQIKGIGMLCVIFIHGSYLSGSQGIPHIFTSYLSRIAVPYFLILFCYFTEKSLLKIEKNKQINYYFNRFKSLFIPFFFWSLVYFLMRVDFTKTPLNSIKIITMYWIGSGWGGQFFFIILFQLILIFPLIRKLANNKLLIYLTLVITGASYIINTYFINLIPSILRIISDRLVLYWIAYALLGILMARGINKFNTSKLFLLIIALMPIENIILISIGNDLTSPYLRPSILITSYLTLPLLVSFISPIKGQAGKIFSLFGKHSMSLFVLNPLVIISMEKISIFPLQIKNIFLSYIMSVLIVFFIAFITLIFSLLIRSSYFSKLA
jgi:fucose 4-O-acetylase-like acetyltransferase